MNFYMRQLRKTNHTELNKTNYKLVRVQRILCIKLGYRFYGCEGGGNLVFLRTMSRYMGLWVLYSNSVGL